MEKVLTEAGGGPSEAHYYYNQDWQLLEERFLDSQEQLSASNQYLWSARYIDSPIMRFHDGNGDGDCLDAGDNIRYYTGDANFNVTATIDGGTVAVVERYVYTAYGEATLFSPIWANPAAPTSAGPLYCGYFFDAETALNQVRNRYYHAHLGIFVTRDSIQADINLYRYCQNVPTVSTDPNGMQAVNGPAKFNECNKKNDARLNQCTWVSGLICAGACSWYCKQKPDPLTLAGICFSVCESAYLLACETDHDIGKTCCQQALAVWAATGEWPGLLWQLLHGCPISAGD